MSIRYIAALLAALLVSPLHAQEFPAPPVGFRTQVMDPTDGRINMPADWSYKSGGTQNGWLWTFAKDRNATNGYDTGFSIQLFLQVRQFSQSSPQAFAQGFLQQKRVSARVVRDCPPSEVGGYSRQCVETVENLQRGLRTRAFRLLYSVFWSNERDQVIVTAFGAPETDWPKLEGTLNTMSEFQLTGAGLGR
jgi:hypothetical protein